eukprot:4953537-Pyramimonas_sp.AAC.1
MLANLAEDAGQHPHGVEQDVGGHRRVLELGHEPTQPLRLREAVSALLAAHRPARRNSRLGFRV